MKLTANVSMLICRHVNFLDVLLTVPKQKMLLSTVQAENKVSKIWRAVEY